MSTELSKWASNVWTEQSVERVVGTPKALTSDLLDRHCKYVAKTLRRDWDWWHVNEGYEGSGKSTGSIHTAMRIASGLFQIREHIVYDGEEVLRLIDDCPRYGSIIVDEAGEAAFSRDWHSDMNKALVKGSQQMRDRNLNVIFNLPALELLDSALRRRFRTLVIYEAPQFVRGRSMWHVPVYNRYGKKGDPYWDLRFVYYMLDLPPRKRSEYVAIKTSRGKERVARYIDQVTAEREKNRDIDPKTIVSKILSMPEQKRATMLNSRGGWSRDRIKYEYNLPDNLARTVVAGLALEAAEG